MREMFKILSERMEEGLDTVLVTVVASSGSTPRGAGSRMLVGKEGRLCGTIGGGNVEHRSREIAQQVLVDKNSHEHDFQLNRSDVENLGMICGGNVNVYFRYIDHTDEDVISLCKEAEKLFEEGSDIWLTEGEKLSLYTSKPETADFCEQINSSGRVYIFGCGHVGQALAPVLDFVGFHVTVCDDRPEFAKKELFPCTCDVKLIDFENIADSITITENDYVCVMTRGHAFDAVVQGQVLKTPACYVGVIGSAHKKAGVCKRLVEEFGVDEKELDRIVSPIGLDIKAETPAEIAISVAAQMIEVRALKNRNGK